jgi:mRNA interferase MazF
VSKSTYHPARCDLIELNFFPAAGREIDKRRPAIVLSGLEYNRRTGLCVVAPLTSQVTQGPLWVPMPKGYLPRPSVILCDYVKSFDYRDRSAVFLARVPEELVRQVVDHLLDLLDPVP